MSDIEFLTGGQVRQPIDLVTGKIAAATRVVAVAPSREHDTLIAGDQYLQLPEWTVENGGPMMFVMDGNGGGSNLIGMGGPNAEVGVTEYSLLGALILIICQVGTITTTANDGDAPEGSRFSAAVQINAGFAQLFICAKVAGIKKWFPIGFATPSP